MRAAVMRDQKLLVDSVAEPEPGSGEVLVKTLACGICGSDLHMLKHAAYVVEQMRRSGAPAVMDPARDVVMGHEFCAEILAYGPECQRLLRAGTRVCSMPVGLRADGPATIGYSNALPGGYGEMMVLNEMLLLAVPEQLSTEHAALTEPMAVGWHAVEKANLTREDVPLVLGCGPIGLAVIAALRIRDARPIIAADFSPARRRLAEQLGADVVIDPAAASPYESWQAVAQRPDATVAASDPMAFLVSPFRPAVIFECVGVPGVIQQVLEGAPRAARVVVVGVCMQTDHLEPLFAINKELNLQFVLGYTPQEFFQTLQHLAEDRINAAPLITGKVGVEGVQQAFADLATPERHAKILVEPWRS
jgi:threonine dehydrogenase-like Zn-dependent dehydrogenase